jgi:hypothetical protein
MIIRPSSNLAKKIKERDLTVLPPDSNPFADWVARLFIADRAQYILVTNSISLYSVIIYGKGVTCRDSLIRSIMDMLRDVMDKDGYRMLYETQVAPQSYCVSLSKAVNRSVTGSMNELEYHAKWLLIRDEMSPYDASFRLNELYLSYLTYQIPRRAFQAMREE